MDWLTDRSRHIARLAHGWLLPMVGGLYALWGVATFVRDNFLSPTSRDRLDTYGLLPHWPATWWLIGGLLIVVVGLVEGSFRVDRQLRLELTGANQRIKDLEQNALRAKATQDMLVKLSLLRGVGHSLLHTHIQSSGGFDFWKEEEGKWQKSVGDCLQGTVPPQTALNFHYPGAAETQGLGDSFNSDHATAKGLLARRLDILAEIIDQAGSLDQV